jgi:hypothetical protein
VFGTAFSGVVGSGRWCGVNVGSRVFRAGFTGTRGSDASDHVISIDPRVTRIHHAGNAGATTLT